MKNGGNFENNEIIEERNKKIDFENIKFRKIVKKSNKNESTSGLALSSSSITRTTGPSFELFKACKSTPSFNDLSGSCLITPSMFTSY